MRMLRLVIAWLVMAALPLQGMAAASMLFCGAEAHAPVAAAGAHDHAAHGHFEQGHGTASGSAAHSHHHGAGQAEQSAAPGGEQGEPQGSAGLPDDGHACPICAACCNLVALSESPAPGWALDTPAVQPVQGSTRVSTRHAPAPDKPPRA